jgi:hypothetical protein
MLCLGSFVNWEKVFDEPLQRNYNVCHLLIINAYIS